MLYLCTSIYKTLKRVNIFSSLCSVWFMDFYCGLCLAQVVMRSGVAFADLQSKTRITWETFHVTKNLSFGQSASIYDVTRICCGVQSPVLEFCIGCFISFLRQFFYFTSLPSRSSSQSFDLVMNLMQHKCSYKAIAF